MPGKAGDRDRKKMLKEMWKMGALIWFAFIGVVTLVMDWDTFFPDGFGKR